MEWERAWVGSRRREEAAALHNLQRRFEEAESRRTQPPPLPLARDNLDNAPHILHKILSNRPEIISEEEEANTDWFDSDFIAECLCWHNVYRQRHAVPSLTLCPELCERAQSWANHLAHTDTFFYRYDKEVGQNLFCRLSNALPMDVTGQEVATYWYSAVKSYNYLKEPEVLHANVNAGQFTQVVWASTLKIGVGKAASRTGKILVVANYWPAGNVSGWFRENVLPPLLDNDEGSPPPPLGAAAHDSTTGDAPDSPRSGS